MKNKAILVLVSVFVAFGALVAFGQAPAYEVVGEVGAANAGLTSGNAAMNDAGEVVVVVNGFGTLYHQNYLYSLRVDYFDSFESVYAMNNSGEFVGVTIPDPVSLEADGFVYSNKGFVLLPRLTPAAINNSGDILGDSVVSGLRNHAVLWSKGQVTDLGPGWGVDSSAAGINDSGQIVGTIQDQANQIYAATYINGQWQSLGLVGMCRGINNANEIIAWSLQLNSAVVNTQGVWTQLSLNGATFSWPYAINNAGQVVGYTVNGPFRFDFSNYSAFLYRDGIVYDLNQLLTLPSPVRLIQAIGINDHRQILAVGDDLGIYLLNPANWGSDPRSDPILTPFPPGEHSIHETGVVHVVPGDPSQDIQVDVLWRLTAT